MVYRNLEDMIRQNSRGRAYYYTLPTDIQHELKSVGDYIHTTDELHAHARFAEKERRDALLLRRK